MAWTGKSTTDPHQGAVIDKEIAATDAIQALITFTREYQDIGNEPPEWQDVKQSIMKSCAGIRSWEGQISLLRLKVSESMQTACCQACSCTLCRMQSSHGKKTTRIRLFCEESFEELHIVCEDDGIGVPPEAKEKIFNREFFNRTGLEMYLAQEILSITGIGIRETGIYGEGACFESVRSQGTVPVHSAQQ